MKGLAALTIALLALSLAAAGCGGDDDGDETVTVQQTVTSEEGTTVEEVETAAEDAETQTLSSSGKRGPAFFSSPSENIGCHISAKGARCDIRERSWEPPPKPKRCEKIGLDYGQGIYVGDDRAEFVCAGDTALGAPTILPYGANSRRGDFRCHSGRKGVTCSHAGNGHGFFLSRGSYRIF